MSKQKIYKHPVMVKLDDDLLRMLDAWRDGHEYKPARGEVVRDALRKFLVDKFQSAKGASAA
jgi:metal-responsive CopG/Arc/MetJ family transcriptional regulator